MTPKKKDSSNILGQAMLVNLSVGMWRARKHDKMVSEKANAQWAKTDKAGRFHKRLFGGDAPAHSALVTASACARSMHRKHTLPWEDEGTRILPTANYFAYADAMREVKARFEEALEAFLLEYPKLIRRAEELLGTMFRRQDYPKPQEIRTKFHFDVHYYPLPTGEDFRVQLPQADLKQMTRGIESRINEAMKDGMTDMWNKLGDVVSKLREKLDDGKNLRDTMVERVGEMAELLGRLNITGDTKFETVRKKIATDLAGLNVVVLKGNDEAREQAAKKADAILKTMQGVYQPTPKKK